MINIISKKKLNVIYEIFISTLAIFATVIAFLDLTGKVLVESSLILYWIDFSILVVFTIDYIARLLKSKDRKRFFVHNILDLIALVPFNSIFRALRLTRLFRLVRLSKVTKVVRFVRLIAFSKKFFNKINAFLHTNGFVYILFITIGIIILGSVGIYFAEYGQTIDSFGDAVWWSFVTATTVGYGDISPVTIAGRIIAAFLMTTGIGFIGMLTGTIATYFLNRATKEKDKISKENILDLSDLDEVQLKEVINFIEFLRAKG